MQLVSPTHILSTLLDVKKVLDMDRAEYESEVSTLCRGFSGREDKANLSNIGVECGLFMLTFLMIMNSLFRGVPKRIDGGDPKRLHNS